MLHNDENLFHQLILATSSSTGIEKGIIEKDYYVTIFLKKIVEKQPQIIFKGGTSLSKCYKVIKRFSEDIDLNLEYTTKPSMSLRKQLKNNIIEITKELNFQLQNSEAIQSRRDFNKYIVDFSSSFASNSLNPFLIVETSVFIRSYPVKKEKASSLIYDYLKQEQREDLIKKYSLEPFELNVQSIERTFIDKIFAISDYYMENKITFHSRHIYDLYKLYDYIQFDESLKLLFTTVKADRKQHSKCPSANDEINIKTILQEIVNNEVYKKDYETNTKGLLFEKVSYEKAISVINKILNSGLLDKMKVLEKN